VTVNGDSTNTLVVARGIDFNRTAYMITSLDDSVSVLLQLLCSNLPSVPNKYQPVDIDSTGCAGLGIPSATTCHLFQDIYLEDGTNMKFGYGFLFESTCTTPNTILNPFPYIPLDPPTLSSGKFEHGCMEFTTSPLALALWNTYFLEINNNTGEYLLTSSTFTSETCDQTSLIWTTVFSATYTLDGFFFF